LKTGESKEGEAPETKVVGEEKFQQMFLTVQRMNAKLYEEKKTRDATSSSKGSKEKKGNENADDNKPPPPSAYSSSLTSYHSSSYSDSQKKRKKYPFLKFDVKFVLPIYDGEMNPKRLDN